jgi:hypothetical protein
MPRPPDSGRVDLREIFRCVQDQIRSQLAACKIFEHATASGAAAERPWCTMLNQYLPRRYRASSAFIIDAAGRRSRQIDIAIYDHFSSPPLFPHRAGLHIPAESVCAVFEVKQMLTRQWIVDAGQKAASVRALHRNGKSRRKILAGVLAARGVWTPQTFSKKLPEILRTMDSAHRLDLGCVLDNGAFQGTKVSAPQDALIFFLLHLLQSLTPRPTPNLLHYLRGSR